MDTEKYKALLCAIEKGSLSAAGEALGYTPSGISRMMTSLEEEVGFALLNRSRNGAIPTEECERLLPVIRQIVSAEKRCREQISEIHGMESGHVSVGSSYTEYYKWLTSIISQFCKAYPNITISISEGTSSELIHMVEEGKIDFCIVSKRKGSFDWIPIKKDDLLVWVPKDNPYVKQGYMPLKALENEPFIEMYPDKETDNSIFLKENNIKVRAKYSTTDTFAAYYMVRSGLGITLVNQVFAQMWKEEEVVALPLEPAKKIDIGIAVPKMENKSPALKKFISFAKDYLP